LRPSSLRTLALSAILSLGPAARAGIVPPAPQGASATTQTFASDILPVPILDDQSNLSTIEVAGMDPYLWDVDLTLFADHDSPLDLDIRLTSPSGTVVVLSTDNGVSADAFFGARFDDQIVIPIRDFTAPAAPLPPLAPEGALSAFVGEDPNGTWTLDCADDTTGSEGQFAWEIDVTSLDAVPVPQVTQIENLDPKPIENPQTTSQILVGPIPMTALIDVDVRVSLEHSDPSDLRLGLAKDGQVVQLSLHNGLTNDFFLDKLFDDDAPIPIGDLAPPACYAAPDGALGRLHGLNPAGTWELRIFDNGPGTGSLYGWELIFTYGAAQPAVTSLCSGESPAPCPCSNHGAPDHGCASAFNPQGARLEGIAPAGIVRLDDDSIELRATQLDPFQLCVFAQGSLHASEPFGDGRLCLGGSVQRLAAKFTGLGWTSYPGLFDAPLADRHGLLAPGGTRIYQVFFRSSLLSAPATPGATARTRSSSSGCPDEGGFARRSAKPSPSLGEARCVAPRRAYPYFGRRLSWSRLPFFQPSA
jgi:subtilisin-like proprotein convertase family protein